MAASQNLVPEGSLNVATVATLVDILRGRALHQPDQKAFTFLLPSEVSGSILCKL